MAVGDGPVQRRLAQVVRGVNPRSLSDQQLHEEGPVLAGRSDQRGPAWKNESELFLFHARLGRDMIALTIKLI